MNRLTKHINGYKRFCTTYNFNHFHQNGLLHTNIIFTQNIGKYSTSASLNSSFNSFLSRKRDFCVSKSDHLNDFFKERKYNFEPDESFKKALDILPTEVANFLSDSVLELQPSKVHICDGSEAEFKSLLSYCEKEGMVKRLTKYENCWLTRTDPKDVARVESKTIISTDHEVESVTKPKGGRKSKMGNWLSPVVLQTMSSERFPGAMRGRTMFIIPFSMGVVGGPISKNGIQLTDSPYVVASMRVMTRISLQVLDNIEAGADFVKCVHTVGQALPMQEKPVNNWPCNPEKTLIAHIPEQNKIRSFGSGYGGNSLLGKKCFSLRLGSIMAKKEGWLAEHMLILGITSPAGVKKYIAAAFPSACGKTNLAMMEPALPGWKIECVGDDIAWMKFDNEGKLRAINPENGFFGVAPGTSYNTNPNAMETIKKNTLFTNVAETSDGGVFWEGLEKEVDLQSVRVTDWKGKPWSKETSDAPAAHPNSRFCTPASQCPIIDSEWEKPKGVVIEAILFGGRRPQGVPLVFEAFDWKHGVFVGAGMRSEATAAAEHASKVIMHDPFAMRPFFGYNFGHYLQHWLSFSENKALHLPKIFHVNWFRKNDKGGFIWPGFGDNIRVLEWIFKRVANSGDTSICVKSPIGWLPSKESINVSGIESYKHLNMEEILRFEGPFWAQELDDIKDFLLDEVNEDLPLDILKQYEEMRKQI